MKKLDKIFRPKTVAVVGASRNESSVGFGIAKNLIHGCSFMCEYCQPFKGEIFLINPKAGEILGKKCIGSLSDVAGKIDLVIIAVPAKIVPMIVDECVSLKVGGIIIISAGFGELGEEGKDIQKKMVDAAGKAGIPVVGPNCLGLINASYGLNASFAPSMPPKGDVGFISQSGALADSIIDWAIEARYGFSSIISIGNQADITITDFIQYLGDDKSTKAIAVYIEGLQDGREFMDVVKKVSRKKPVVVLKAGRSPGGQKAISSHTGSIAGAYEIYRAAFRQCGAIAADSVEELFDIAKALATQPACKNNSVAIITNAGGPGVLTADYCEERGIELAELSERTLRRLDDSGKMHPAYSRHNPLDLVGDALPERYEEALDAVLAQKNVGAAIVIQTLQTMTDPLKDAEIVINMKKKYKDKPIICTYMGGRFSKEGVELLEKHGIPDFNDPKKAATVMKALIDRGKWLK